MARLGMINTCLFVFVLSDYMYVIWYLECVACPNYEVARVVQLGLQPQTAATPVLDTG